MAKTTSKENSKKKAEKLEETSAPAPQETEITPPPTVEEKQDEPKEKAASVEMKLISLFSLQQIDSQIDKIKIIRGELPLEVQDLEDEIAGLETRIDNFIDEMQNLEKSMVECQNAIKDCKILIKKYEEQQANVRNNREYDSLTKEVEYQNLEIQLNEKKIREFKAQVEFKKTDIEKAQSSLNDKKNDLEIKKAELDDIIAETEKEEQELMVKSQNHQTLIEERLLTAYKRIRKNASNGLAVVSIERDACGGCFNKIPPQRQLDIKMHKKIIVCEYCGRILVDNSLAESIKI